MFLNVLEKDDIMVMTSQPSTGSLQEAVQKIKDQGYSHVIGLPIATGLSSTMNGMKLACDMLEMPVTLVDTKGTASNQKYLVEVAAKLAHEGKSPEEIKDIQIADIACGSGIFLEEAYQFLVDYCTEWYMQHNPEHLLELSNGKKKLPLADKKDILTRCIYGVDIDVHAVEVSKFSLLIKLIEDETPASVKECVPILPDLSSNIKNGNSLICREDISGKDMSIEALCNIKPFEWSMINSGSKFDAIIGNPPYVKQKIFIPWRQKQNLQFTRRNIKVHINNLINIFYFLKKRLIF